MKPKILLSYLLVLLNINNAWSFQLDENQKVDFNIIENLINNSKFNPNLKEFNLLNNELIDLKKNYKEIDSTPVIKHCIKFDNVIFTIKNLQISKFNYIFDEIKNQCLSKDNLELITSKIIDYYKIKGFVVDLSLKKINREQKKLIIEINFKKIAKIIYLKNDRFQTFNKITAFGFYHNKILNFNDLDQALNQINRLSSNQAKISIIDKKDSNNDLTLVVENKKKIPISFNINYDNLGNSFTGKRRLSSNLSIDNFINLNDYINLNITSNSDIKNQDRYLRSFSSLISIPFNYYLFSYDFSRTVFINKLENMINRIEINGYSQRYNFSIEKVFFKNHNHELKIICSLTNKKSSNYVNNQKIISSQRNLTLLNLGLDHIIKTNKYSNLSKIYFIKGTKLLGAQKDSQINYLNDNQNFYPKAQFKLIRLNNILRINDLIKINNTRFNYSSEIEYQYSSKKLYGSEQIAVGGYQSVRGFNDIFLTGDLGYNLRNNLNTNLGSLFNNKILAKQINNFLYNSNITLFYDYGYSRQNYTDEKKDGRLSGIGFKVNYNNKNLSISITNSWPISKSNLLNNTIKERFNSYFELFLGI